MLANTTALDFGAAFKRCRTKLARRLTRGALTAVLCLSVAGTAFAWGELTITEIDYDQPGSDTAEWVEIHNTQDYEYILDGVSLVLYDGDLNGTCTEYCRIDLSPLGWILDGGYVVIGAHPCASLPLCAGVDAIQNGPDVITIEESGNVLFRVEYASGLTESACQTPVSSRTSAADSDTADGSIQLCGSVWSFKTTKTACSANSCE